MGVNVCQCGASLWVSMCVDVGANACRSGPQPLLTLYVPDPHCLLTPSTMPAPMPVGVPRVWFKRCIRFKRCILWLGGKCLPLHPDAPPPPTPSPQHTPACRLDGITVTFHWGYHRRLRLISS